MVEAAAVGAGVGEAGAAFTKQRRLVWLNC